jgi:hypothetical protein
MGGIFRARAEGLVGEAAIELETLLRQVTITGAGQKEIVQKPPVQKPPVQKEPVQKQPAQKGPLQKPFVKPAGPPKYQAKPAKQPARDQKRRFPIKPVS